jgi:hypothetical protein
MVEESEMNSTGQASPTGEPSVQGWQGRVRVELLNGRFKKNID